MESETRVVNGAAVQGSTAITNGHRQKVTNRGLSSEKEKTVNNVHTDGLRDQFQGMIQDVMDEVSRRVNDIISEFIQQSELPKTEKTKKLHHNSQKYQDKRASSKTGPPPNKEFIERNSLLTELYKDPHIRTVYNMFIVILIMLIIYSVIYDIVETGMPKIGLTTIITGFSKLSATFYIWCKMKASALGIYVPFNIWAQERLRLLPRYRALKAWDYGWLLAFVTYQILFIVLPTKALLEEDLPFGSTVIILMEQARLLMKTHAFVRSVAPRFLAYKPHTETSEPVGPGFSHFLYFMFAPTLVYRDSYPRVKEIRWKFVIWHYTEVLLVIFYVALVTERYIVPSYQDFGTHPVEPRALVVSIFGLLMPSMIMFLSGFYCLLHAWMNASAELLRFADRLFYKDWWTSATFSVYYRTWNIVVHDWLHTYIYKDINEILMPGSRGLATCAVFYTSALFHEYILAFSFRFFYPVMFTMFGGLGLLFFFVPKLFNGNIFLWFSLCTGSSLMVNLYAIEFFARVNCPSDYDGLLDCFVPRSWFCNGLTNASSTISGRT